MREGDATAVDAFRFLKSKLSKKQQHVNGACSPFLLLHRPPVAPVCPFCVQLLYYTSLHHRLCATTASNPPLTAFRVQQLHLDDDEREVLKLFDVNPPLFIVFP